MLLFWRLITCVAKADNKVAAFEGFPWRQAWRVLYLLFMIVYVNNVRMHSFTVRSAMFCFSVNCLMHTLKISALFTGTITGVIVRSALTESRCDVWPKEITTYGWLQSEKHSSRPPVGWYYTSSMSIRRPLMPTNIAPSLLPSLSSLRLSISQPFVGHF